MNWRKLSKTTHRGYYRIQIGQRWWIRSKVPFDQTAKREVGVNGETLMRTMLVRKHLFRGYDVLGNPIIKNGIETGFKVVWGQA